jgi:hypothetical protein
LVRWGSLQARLGGQRSIPGQFKVGTISALPSL